MSFEPEPGDRITLDRESLEFTALETSGPASHFIYAEYGKAGAIYRVKRGREYCALKVFYPGIQNKRLLANTDKIGQFRGLEGLIVAERTSINHDLFPSVIQQYPELDYSVLMPWIQGTVWLNLMNDGNEIPGSSYLQLARRLLKVICNLESRGLAHCDLSNQNFVIGHDLAFIELIDIEDMYAPDMPRPLPDISYGTPGYRNEWIAAHGLWGPESDRFATAILTAEILTWGYSEIRENKAGESSFFDEKEDIGKTSERYQLMMDCLGRYHRDLQELFQRAWSSENLDQCPPVCAWKEVIDQIETPAMLEIKPDGPRSPTPEPAGTGIGHGTVIHGLPARMELSHTALDFGLITQSNTYTELIIRNSGGSELTGTIKPAGWLEVSSSNFLIKPGSQLKIRATLISPLPQPKSGQEYRAAYAIAIESNVVSEVLGGSFRLPKKRWYTTWFGLLSIIAISLCCVLTALGGTGVILWPLPIYHSTSTATPSRVTTASPTGSPIPDDKATLELAILLTAQAAATGTSLATECTRGVSFFGNPNYNIARCDFFDSNINNWSTGNFDDEYGTRKLTINGGKFRWEWSAKQGVISRDTYNNLKLTDFELTAGIQKLDGPTKSACYGLSFRESSTGFYWWEVCDDQTFVVDKHSSDGSNVINLVKWTNTTSINPSSQNQLTVIALGAHFDLYINQGKVGSFDDHTNSSGIVGFGVELNSGDSATYEFDYIAVRSQ